MLRRSGQAPTSPPSARNAPALTSSPLDLAEKAAVITCDSPQQAAHYLRRFFVDPAALTALGAVVAGEEPGRTGDADITVHCSVGLAGTEVLLGARLLGLGP